MSSINGRTSRSTLETIIGKSLLKYSKNSITVHALDCNDGHFKGQMMANLGIKLPIPFKNCSIR